MSLGQIKNIIQNNYFDNIYLTGFVDSEENGLAEFVASMNYLFLEFGDELIKIEAIEQYSKISLAVVNDIQIAVDLEDVTPAKSKVSNVIFNNPLLDNKVSEIVLFNMKEDTEGMVCDAFKLVLLNKQEIFFDPSFLGINVGGSEVEELWRDNQKEYYESISTIIKF
ncbi:hypothetical protein ACP26L_31850 [Paenibacillus sp. S-38]|uniref:hypothetical protein n=1 Tax=Paenibacillus sp. S-38 TaxID=3416710 RepID=UPI003CF280CD